MKNFVLKENADGTVVRLIDLQNKSLEILKGFDAICKENKIEYSLAYGTALGARRHLGFIPWDDDIDVMMNYENYDKLVSVLKSNDIAPYYFHCFETDVKYNVTLPEMKFRLEGTYVIEKNTLLKNKCEGDGLFIDVFIVDHLSDSKIKNNLRRFLSMLLVPMMVVSVGWVYDFMNEGGIDVSSIYPYSKTQFEGKEFPCPCDMDAYLKAVYSDTYMELVPESQRKPKHIADIKL